MKESSEMNMSIYKILETIESAVFSAQRLPWPCNEWSVIHRHNFLRLLDKMRQSVPEELKQARAVSKESQRILAEAQEAAQELLDKAREQARAMVESARAEREALLNTTDVVTQAREKADELERVARTRAEQVEAQTRVRCQELREKAEAYAEEVKQKAHEETRRNEGEIDAYAARTLASLERELTRAADVVRSHREMVERPRGEEPVTAVTPGKAHAAPAGLRPGAAHPTQEMTPARGA